MAKAQSAYTADEQRRYQAIAWELDPEATWAEIEAHVREKGQGTVFLDPEDWRDTMVDLYGEEIFAS